jgi:hypothetical protein
LISTEQVSTILLVHYLVLPHTVPQVFLHHHLLHSQVCLEPKLIHPSLGEVQVSGRVIAASDQASEQGQVAEAADADAIVAAKITKRDLPTDPDRDLDLLMKVQQKVRVKLELNRVQNRDHADIEDPAEDLAVMVEEVGDTEEDGVTMGAEVHVAWELLT